MFSSEILHLSVIHYLIGEPNDIIQNGRQDCMKTLRVLIPEPYPEVIVPSGCFWQGDELGSPRLHPELIYACAWNSTREARVTHSGRAIYLVQAMPVLFWYGKCLPKYSEKRLIILTHKIDSIPCPHGQAMEHLLWVQNRITVARLYTMQSNLDATCLVFYRIMTTQNHRSPVKMCDFKVGLQCLLTL